MTLFYNEFIETMDHEKIAQIQLQNLQEIVKHAYERVPFYRQRMDKRGRKPDDIRALSDIRSLDFTVKTDLRDYYPYGMFAVPMEEVARIHASSGTTGKPVVAGYTRGDLDNWAECIARLAFAAGVRRQDIVQVSFGYGLFTGAFGLHQGIEKIGAAIVPISSGNTERQIELMRDFGSTVLIATPSYAMYLAEMAEQKGYLKDIKLRYGLFGSEASTEEMRAELEKRFNILATDNYGLTEVMGPGVSGECEHQCGMHINEDHFLCEIIDPDTGEPLAPGEQGEMVITTLTKKAMPMLRYRTRDITRIITEKCACGRTSYRMEKIKGRSDDMLIIRGVNVFPSQVEGVLSSLPGLSPHFLMVVGTKNNMDTLEIRVEMTPELMSDTVRGIEQAESRIRSSIASVLGLSADIRLTPPGSIERSEGKAKRVLDTRVR